MTDIHYNIFIERRKIKMVKQNKEIIGETIRRARKDRKLTQTVVAYQVGITRNYLSDIENGRYAPSSEKLISIAKVLDINLDLLSRSMDLKMKV
jgi:transcriptional regulator with XRE-family HTH domain